MSVNQLVLSIASHQFNSKFMFHPSLGLLCCEIMSHPIARLMNSASRVHNILFHNDLIKMFLCYTQRLVVVVVDVFTE